MHRFKILSIFAAVAISLAACGSVPENATANRNYMWFDAEGNYATLSHPDSIRYYLAKCKEHGFGNVVVDMKNIMGEVLYDSGIAPYMGEWKGVVRSRDYDMFRYFLDYGHELDMNVFASMNIFCGGHNFFDRGIIYEDKADWQSICYEKGKLVPISTIKTNYNGMLNPCDPQVQEYQLDILKEFITKYPDTDGLIFDRVRYDEMTSDFSELSRRQFEEHTGIRVENFPEDILSWYGEDGSLREKWELGRYAKPWIEWRAGVIRAFLEKTRKALKEISPELMIGDYTGAWYPTYWQVGVNWASKEYDPSAVPEYSRWATSTYKNTGYAELLDVYMTGLYYSLITKDDVDKATGVVGQRSEAGMDDSLTYCYSIEGGAEMAESITMGAVPVTGSIYVEQYKDDFSLFAPAVKQALRSTDGVMIFDICHLIKHGLWDDLKEAMATETNQHSL